MYCQLDYAALAGDDHITFSLTSCRRIVSLSTHTLIIATTGASAYISHLLPPPLCRSFLRIDSVVTASEGGVFNAGIGVQGRPSCLQRYEGSGGGGGGAGANSNSLHSNFETVFWKQNNFTHFVCSEKLLLF